MKRIIQKWLFAMAILTLAVAMGKGITASAATVASGNCGDNGDNVTWTLDDTGLLTISGTGDMDYWVHPATLPWYSKLQNIKKVQFGEDVTSVGAYAFYGCTNLTQVSLPAGLTRVEGYAFAFCSNLMEVNLPDTVDRIRDFTFYGCSALSFVTIPESTQVIGKYAYAGCSSLTNVAVPDSVIKIEDYGFAWCSSLTDITLSKTIPEIGNNVFFGCNDDLLISYSEDSGTASPSELSAVTGADTTNAGKQNYSVFRFFYILFSVYLRRR